MGNRIKLESTPLELAQLHFELGFRADFHKGIKGLRDILSPTQNFKSLEAKGISDEVWQLLHCLSWKERHAKGVPVKMTFEQWSYACDMPGPGPRDGYQHGLIGGADGTPRVRVFDRSVGEGLQPKHMATFCNFRYKPEWLEKKKREPYICKEERCFGKGDCDKVGCWKNRKPDLGYSDFDSPPIGGFKD